MSPIAARKPDHDDDDEDEDEEEFLGEDEEEDEDDDDEEADFVPGDEEEEEEEEEENSLYGLLRLEGGSTGKIVYQGDGFNLTATSDITWNLLDRQVKPKEESYSVEMYGTCDVTPVLHGKPSPRKLQVTFSVVDAPPTKSNDDSKLPPIYYRVSGHEIDSSGGETLEFQGGYHAGDGKQVSLVCQTRLRSNEPSAAAAAAPPAAAAAASRGDDDDDDDFDDDVNYNELIALHEDAGLSVDALRKRMQEGGSDSKPAKRGKSTQDDDDDEDGF
jgi:hypothetical protein